MALILSAKYDGDNCVEIEQFKFQPGIGWKCKTDFIDTTPLGQWTELFFSAEENVSYIDFLKTMTAKTLDTCRKMAKLALDQYEDASKGDKFFALQALTLIDRTFIPPEINLECRWQCELLDYMISTSSLHVVATCRNPARLIKYCTALQEGRY
jgi:hypothetical protein